MNNIVLMEIVYNGEHLLNYGSDFFLFKTFAFKHVNSLMEVATLHPFHNHVDSIFVLEPVKNFDYIWMVKRLHQLYLIVDPANILLRNKLLRKNFNCCFFLCYFVLTKSNVTKVSLADYFPYVVYLRNMKWILLNIAFFKCKHGFET